MQSFDEINHTENLFASLSGTAALRTVVAAKIEKSCSFEQQKLIIINRLLKLTTLENGALRKWHYVT